MATGVEGRVSGAVKDGFMRPSSMTSNVSCILATIPDTVSYDVFTTSREPRDVFEPLGVAGLNADRRLGQLRLELQRGEVGADVVV
jgi:hypothetical protein